MPSRYESDGSAAAEFHHPGAENIALSRSISSQIHRLLLGRFRLMITRDVRCAVENTFWLTFFSHETERRGIIAKFQILLLLRDRAHKTQRSVPTVSGFYLAELDFRRRAANGLPQSPHIPAGLANLFQHPVRTRKACHTDHIHGFSR